MSGTKYFSVDVKDPSKNPKTYQSDSQLLENPVLYDFCSHFSDVESTCTPPDVKELKDEYIEKEKKYFPHDEIDNSPVYAKIPREVYDKILSLIQDRNSVKNSRYTWTAEEDERLISLVNLHGPRKWSVIAQALGTSKPAKQCRERYTNHLDPDIKKGDWTLEEDSHIVQYHDSFGSQWSKIAKFMKGRTANAIKNRWHGYLKKLSIKDKNAIIVNRIPIPDLNTLHNNHTEDQHVQQVRIPTSLPIQSNQELNNLENGIPRVESLDFDMYYESFPSNNSGIAFSNEDGFYNDAPFSSDFSGNNNQYLKLDTSSDTILDHDTSVNDMNDFDFPAKRKRENEFYIVGKKMKLESIPENLDLSLIYEEEDFIESDPIFFNNEASPKQSNNDYSIELSKDEDIFQSHSNNIHSNEKSPGSFFESWISSPLGKINI